MVRAGSHGSVGGRWAALVWGLTIAAGACTSSGRYFGDCEERGDCDAEGGSDAGGGGSSASPGEAGASGSSVEAGATGQGGSGLGGEGAVGGDNGSSGDSGSGGGHGPGGGGSGAAIGGDGGTGGDATAGTGGAGAVAGEGQSAGAAGSGGEGDDITAVRPTSGCTLAAPGDLQFGDFTERHMEVSGTKEADSTDTKIDGPWTMDREYFVRLPNGYDDTKAYPLVLQGPGCGGTGENVYGLPDITDQVIRVGLTPPDPNIVGHAIAPGAGCFDDHEGDDSVDWPFYEAVRELLASELCFDQNRVFASGNSSGGYFANELGCKYAGNAEGYAIRAIAVNTGGLPTEPAYRPTCSDAPLAGIWVHESDDATQPFAGNKVAIARAMQVNGCTVGTNYDDTSFDNYPIGGGNTDDTCRKIQGCPELYPLVVCELPGNGHGSHDSVANPGFATFISSFAAP